MQKIKHSTIHPYSHEENGLAERANQEVIRHLTAVLTDTDIRKNFPDYLPFIQRIINSQVNIRTNVSPTQLIFGNAINHDEHFLSEPIQNDLDKSAKEYMSNMLQIQQKIMSIAQQTQEMNDTHHIISQENSMYDRAKSEKVFHFREGNKSAWKEKLPSKWIKHLNDRVSDSLLDAFGWLR